MHIINYYQNQNLNLFKSNNAITVGEREKEGSDLYFETKRFR